MWLLTTLNDCDLWRIAAFDIFFLTFTTQIHLWLLEAVHHTQRDEAEMFYIGESESR